MHPPALAFANPKRTQMMWNEGKLLKKENEKPMTKEIQYEETTAANASHKLNTHPIVALTHQEKRKRADWRDQLTPHPRLEDIESLSLHLIPNLNRDLPTSDLIDFLHDRRLLIFSGWNIIDFRVGWRRWCWLVLINRQTQFDQFVNSTSEDGWIG